MASRRDTRTEILRALREVLTESGPKGATLEAVAARAGVSKGGLLYHFGTKEALFEGLLDHLRTMSTQEVADAGDHPGGIVAAYLAGSLVAQDEFTRALVACLGLLGTPGVDVEGAVGDALGAWTATLEGAVGDPVRARLVQLVGDGLYLRALCGQTTDNVDAAVVGALVATSARHPFVS